MSGAGLAGASIGDSEAWWFGASAAVDLTASQRRKPLLGTGEAVVVPFAMPRVRAPGTLLLGSDGLFKYAPRDRVAAVARGSALEYAPAALIALARLPGGGLQDDAAVILCRTDPSGRLPARSDDGR